MIDSNFKFYKQITDDSEFAKEFLAGSSRGIGDGLEANRARAIPQPAARQMKSAERAFEAEIL